MDLSSKFLKAGMDALVSHKIARRLEKIPKEEMLSTLDKIKEIFSKEQALLHLDGNFVVVGDIHGHLLDLSRVIKEYGPPPEINYIFLGDIVDRGEWSIECLYIIYQLKIKYPENVFILRGNHEFNNPVMDFHRDQEQYFQGDDLFEIFINVFKYTPIAAIINNDYICLHGGIGPSVVDTSVIASIEHPLLSNSEVVDEIVWSDPIDDKIDFEDSIRGCGFFFGEQPVINFLNKSHLRAIIRGHASIEAGCDVLFGGRVYTVHTASCMSSMDENKSGALLLIKGKDPVPKVFDSIRASDYYQIRSLDQDPFAAQVSMSLPRPIPKFKAFRRQSKTKMKINLG